MSRPAFFLSAMAKLPTDTPFILEHLPQEEYPPAQAYVLASARAAGVRFYTPISNSPGNTEFPL